MQDIVTGAAGRSYSPRGVRDNQSSDNKPQTIPTQTPTDAAQAAHGTSREKRKSARRVRTERGSVLIMALTAILGATGGAIAAKHCGNIPAGVLLNTHGSFLSLFLARTIYGGVFLLAEYILGFFALGGALVWIVPLLCGMGTGVALAGAGENMLALLPAAVITLAAAVFGAELSESLSGQLLRVLSGSRTGLVITNGTAADYTLRFLGLLGVNIAAGIIEAGIKISL